MSERRPIVLVTGGRDYADWERVFAVLDELQPGLVVEGGCRSREGEEQAGADWWAWVWGNDRGVHVVTVSALWGKWPRAAGPRRNRVMVELVRRLGGQVVAFPGGRGTVDCVRQARAAGLTVREVSSTSAR